MTIRAALLILTALPVGARAQSTQNFTLRGNDVAVYNVAGRITIERGSGSDVVVEVTRRGDDAGELRLEHRTVDGRDALCVVYPNERIVYRDPSRRSNSSNSTSSNDCRTEGSSRFGRNKIEVSTQGRGVEAWADIRVSVPNGRQLRVKHMVGSVEVTGVDASVMLDVGAGSVSTRDTRGSLSIDAGSGGTTVMDHRGDLDIDVGSGSVRFENVNGRIVKIDSGSGAVRATDVEADELNVDTGSGSVEMTGVAAGPIVIARGPD